jgi:N-acetylneuraminic acid mutarotase
LIKTLLQPKQPNITRGTAISKKAALILILFLTSSFIMAAKPASSTTPVENSWTSKAPMPTARGGLGVAVVNGKIYAIGGSTIQVKESRYVSGGVVGVNEEYDPATDTWTTKASMPTPRAFLAVAVYQNKIYCIGGSSGDSTINGELEQITDVNEVYDPATDTWTTKSPMPMPNSKVQANVVNGKIFILGGNDDPTFNQVYDPESDSWTTKASIPIGTYLFGSAVVDDKIYALVYFSNTTGFNSKIEIYDPLTDNWSSGAGGRHDFSSGAAATTGIIALKRLYVFTGWATMATNGDGTGSQPFGGNPAESNQIYDPTNDSWTLGAVKPTNRIDFGVAVVNDTLYVIGGIVRRYPIVFGWSLYNDTPTAVNEQYTPIGYGTPDPSYVLEHTAPKITFESPINQTYTNSSILIVFMVNKNITSTSYSLDGQQNITITGNTTLTGLSNGLHNVTVYANDNFGNMGASPTVTFTVAKPEPFPKIFVVVASVAAVAVMGVGLLVYFKKRKH